MDYERDDLVSTTAIVAGAVTGVVVTVMSFLLTGDESAPAKVAAPAPVAATAAPAADPVAVEMTPVTLAYVQRITGREYVAEGVEPVLSIDAVEARRAAQRAVTKQALEAMWRDASERPEDTALQARYLALLRSAQADAFEAARDGTPVLLAARFDRHAASFPDSEEVALESAKMIAQRLSQDCTVARELRVELRELAVRHPTEAMAGALLAGLEAGAHCAVDAEASGRERSR